MRHPADANELLEVIADELRTVVGDHSWCFSGVQFSGSLENRFDILFRHLLADLLVHDGSRVAIDDARHVVKCPANIEIGNVHMPMPMGTAGLMKSFAFRFGFRRFTSQEIRFAQYPIDRRWADRRWADRDDVTIEHHVGQSPISIKGKLKMKTDDGITFPVFEPVITRD